MTSERMVLRALPGTIEPCGSTGILEKRPSWPWTEISAVEGTRAALDAAIPTGECFGGHHLIEQTHASPLVPLEPFPHVCGLRYRPSKGLETGIATDGCHVYNPPLSLTLNAWCTSCRHVP